MNRRIKFTDSISHKELYESYRSLLRLGVRFNEFELKSAYRKLSRESHPDVGGSESAFIRVKNAYDYLCNFTADVGDVEVSDTQHNVIRMKEKDSRVNYGPCPECDGTRLEQPTSFGRSHKCIRCNGLGEVELFNPVLRKMTFSGSRQQRKPRNKKRNKPVTGKFRD